MKRSLLLVPLLGFTSLFPSSLQAQTADETDVLENAPYEATLATARLVIPAGTSSWDVAFAGETAVGPLKVYWVQGAACAGFTATVDVLDGRTWQWTPTRFENGTFLPAVASTSRLRVVIQQNVMAYATCDVQIKTQVAQTPTPQVPSAGTRTLAGVLDYNGGFAAKARIPLTAPLFADRLEILVPNYCEGTEILEAGVAQGASSFKGTLSTGRPQVLTLSQPLWFDAVDLVVIGPQGKACQIPVFAYARATLPAPTPVPVPTPVTTTRFLFDGETFEVESLAPGA